MITVITRWDQSQMEPKLEWRMWRQLRGAFNIDRFVFTPVVEALGTVGIDQYESMTDALWHNEGAGRLIFLEPSGLNTMYDLPARNEDIVIVIGNTQLDNTKHATFDSTYRISTPGKTDLYGTNAAAIMLSHWCGS